MSGSVAQAFDDVCQGPALDVGHREVLEVASLTGSVDGDNVRLMQGCQDRLLAKKTSWRSGDGKSLRIVLTATRRLSGSWTAS